ncbi:hypothetical protein PIB30_090222 [Stylosanthes scabra]|uniref:Uncharacterized protein n=1 Tax=Stylosanthes scabra TaxID=79078 RepID=A0ABU6SVU0_9FABA|nr:hypothetical protein [Stylosanthes scabra]
MASTCAKVIVTIILLAMFILVPSKVAAGDISQTFSNSKADGVIGKDISVGGYTAKEPSQANRKEKAESSNVDLDGLDLENHGGCRRCCFAEGCTICCDPRSRVSVRMVSATGLLENWSEVLGSRGTMVLCRQ